jgi:hypothetical protein
MSQSDLPSYGAPPEPGYVTTPIVEEPARLGPAQRFIGTIFSPGETFADINRKPTWLVPLLISVVLSVAFGFFFEWRVKPNYEDMMRKVMKTQTERSGQPMPPDNVIKQQAAFAHMMGRIAPFLIALVYTFFIAGVFALGLLLMSAQTTFKKILSVVAWTGAATGFVSVLVLAASLMLRDEEGLREIDLTDPSSLSATSLAAILPSDASPVVKSLASSFDIFTIWNMVLLSMGFAAIAGAKKFTTGKTATLVFGLWALWIVIKVGWTAAFS